MQHFTKAIKVSHQSPSTHPHSHSYSNSNFCAWHRVYTNPDLECGREYFWECVVRTPTVNMKYLNNDNCCCSLPNFVTPRRRDCYKVRVVNIFKLICWFSGKKSLDVTANGGDNYLATHVVHYPSRNLNLCYCFQNSLPLIAFLNHVHNLQFDMLTLNSHLHLSSKWLFSFRLSENAVYASGIYRMRS
jgi:hypothetical protein